MKTPSLAVALVCACVALIGCYTTTPSSRDARVAAYLAAQADAPRETVSGTLTLEQAMRLATDRSATIAAARANWDALRASIDSAVEIENPELRIGDLNLQDFTEQAPGVDVRIRVRPPRPIEGDAQRAQAVAQAREAESRLHAEELAVRTMVRLRYVEVLLTRDEVASRSALRDAAAELVTATERQLAEGRKTKLDLAQVEFERERAAFEAAGAIDAQQHAESELAELVGAALPLTLAEIEPVAILPGLDVCVAEGLSQNPEVEEKLARLDEAHALLDEEKTQQIPWISYLDLGYTFAPNTDDPLGFFVGAGVTLPIFDTNSAGVTAAEAAVKAREAEVDGEISRAGASLRTLHRRAELTSKVYTHFKTKTRPAADRALEEAQRALESSTITDVEFLEAKIRAMDTRAREDDLQRDAALAALALDEVGECVHPK